jgi:hypothetical protein
MDALSSSELDITMEIISESLCKKKDAKQSQECQCLLCSHERMVFGTLTSFLEEMGMDAPLSQLFGVRID